MSKDNGKEPKLIFSAEQITLPDGKLDIRFTCKTKHIPTLDTIYNELNYHIIMLRAENKTKQTLANQKIIQGATTLTLDQILKRGQR